MQFMVQGSTLFIGMPVFFYLLKVPDHIIALLGIVSKLSAYVTFGLSKSDTQIYACKYQNLSNYFINLYYFDIYL